MGCNSEICDVCSLERDNQTLLSKAPYNNQYLILDDEVIVNQIDLLQQDIQPLQSVIILQSVLTQIRNRNISIYNQLNNLIRNSSKRFVVFANENFAHTYVDRVKDERMEDYHSRLIVKAAAYFTAHFKPFHIRVVIVTNGENHCSMYSKAGDVNVMTISSFVESLGEQFKSIADHLNVVSIQNSESIKDESLKADNVYDEKKKMYVLSKDKGDNVMYYNYLDDVVLKQGEEAGHLFKGIFHSNQDNIMEGRVNIHTNGNETSVLIQSKIDINRAVDGDQVYIEIYPKEEWKKESDYLVMNDNEESEAVADGKELEHEKNATITGRIVGIAKRNWKTYCGSIEPTEEGSIHSSVLFDPVNRRIPKIRVKTSQYNALLSMRIVVAIDDWPVTSFYPIGHYVKTLGKLGDREVETQVILLEHAIPPNVFSREVLECLPPKNWKITEENCKGRVDLRDKVCIVSIDPPGCKDIDDALHARDLENGNIECGIHIADVSYYIKHNSALDKEARNRSTSTYLVDRRLDMLPKLLTENLCSLVGGEDRFAFSVLVEMTKDADIVGVRCVKTIIRSTKAMTYGDAQSYLDNRDTSSTIGHSIHLLFGLSKKLKQRRLQAGALTLSSPEVKFVMDDERADPVDMKNYETKDTNSLVEEFMLLGNCIVAKRIVEAYPKIAILRRHPKPDKSRFENLIRVAKHAGFLLNCDSNKELADSLDKAVVPDHPYFNKLLRILTTRCMTQAVYFPAGEVTPELFYHYGLAAPIYTHFTSPIRRYADVMVHRLLAAAEGIAPLPNEYKEKDFMVEATDTMNYRHYNAQMAGRDSVELYTLTYFNDRDVKACGVIMSCKKNGIKVWIPRYGIEGTIYINNTSKKNKLNRNYNNDWDYDPETCVLSNQNKANDTLETFQPITVGIKVQELRGYRKELILSVLSPLAFDETKVESAVMETEEEITVPLKKSSKREATIEEKEDKRMKL